MSSRKQPNLLQKLVRGVIRDLISQSKSQKAKQPTTLNTKELTYTKSRPKPKLDKSKRSRHIPAKIRVSVLHRDGYRCVFCGRNAKQVQLEVDHIMPFSRGGSNELNNLQTLCIDCNRGKGVRNLS